jgi:hypothetical protein
MLDSGLFFRFCIFLTVIKLQGEINNLRTGFLGAEPCVMAVDMSGTCYVWLTREWCSPQPLSVKRLEPLITPLRLRCVIARAPDNSAWSLSCSPPMHHPPFVCVGTNAHEVFVWEWPKAPTERITEASASLLQGYTLSCASDVCDAV